MANNHMPYASTLCDLGPLPTMLLKHVFTQLGTVTNVINVSQRSDIFFLMILTLLWSERPNQPESLSWSERPNQPEYRGTFKLRTVKLCHQIMANYFSSSHVVMFKCNWQPSIFCNAGYFHGCIASIAMQICSRTPFLVLVVMIVTQ